MEEVGQGQREKSNGERQRPDQQRDHAEEDEGEDAVRDELDERVAAFHRPVVVMLSSRSRAFSRRF